MWRKGNLCTLLMGMYIAVTENSSKIPQKIKIEEPSNQVIPLLGIHPKEMKFVFKISALQ